MAHRKLLYKNPKADLKIKYPKLKEVGIIIAIGLLTVLFFSFKDFKPTTHLKRLPNVTIDVKEIPRTVQYKRPLPPNIPKIPIPSPEPDLPDLVKIWNPGDESGNIVVGNPPIEEEIEVPFPLISEKPKITFKVLPVYPEIARRVGISGRVFVEILINTKGAVEEAKIVQGHPMLNDAALEAVRKWQFSPAKQRDRLVKVRMTIPVDFKLKN